MSAIKKFLVFLVTVAVSSAIEGFEPGLRAKFGIGPDPSSGEKFFFDLPKTKAEAKSAKWDRTQRPPGYLPQLVMYCPGDKVVCCLYDDTGHVAGLQVALSKSEFSENVLDWEKRGFTSWDTTVDKEPKSFWTQQVYFVDEEYLAASKEKRLASRDHSRTLQAGAVWYSGDDSKQLRKVSNREEDIVREHLFLKQSCVPGMGQHYYYNMSTETECTAEQLYPWNIIMKNGEACAVGFLTVGKLQVPKTRNWFERVNREMVESSIPDGPTCLYELSANPGGLSLHFFFVDKPWTITCPA